MTGPGSAVGWLLGSERILDVPDRLTDVASWHTHTPFAFWCIQALRPRVLVELGTHRGDSYSAFCQAVARERLPTTCYAVDTWRGDPHAGEYGEQVLRELREYHDPRFASFSRLVRSTFDEAATHFADGSIDLLHIDGLHTYDAVRHDLDTWAPRLSTAAVVLLHDVNVRERGFGVWKLWEELQREHPSFTFHHGNGLGVLVWGDDAPGPARRLAASTPAEQEEIRRLFANLGEAAAARGRIHVLEDQAKDSARLQRALDDAEQREKGLAEEIKHKEQTIRERERALEEARQQAERALEQARQQAERLQEELVRAREQARLSTRRLLQSLRGLPHRLAHAGWVLLELLYWTATFQLVAGLRRRKYARLIRRAEVFDPEFYLSQVGNSRLARRDPLAHYLRKGSAQGLHPNAFFDAAWYRKHTPGLAPGKEPLVHYLRYGAREGRATGPFFDTAFYLRKNPEVQGSALNPLAHYLRIGAARGLPCAPRASESPVYTTPREAVHALIIDHRLLTPREDSGSVRMLAIVKLIRQLGVPVTFAADQDYRSEPDERRLRDLGVDLLFGKAAIADHLCEHGQRYAVAILSRPDVANRYLALVRRHALWARVVYDTVDLHWVRMERAAAVTRDPAKAVEADRYRRLEQMLAAAADVTLTVTAKEQRILQEAVPSAPIEVIPNIHTIRRGSPPCRDRSGLMFIGGFEHAPNVDAVEWCVREILPLIHRQLPDVVLRVVGSKMPERLQALQSEKARMLGWVPEVDPVFDSSRVFVAPVRFGAGMLGKIGQSIEHGLPVVTTTIGAEGIGLVNGETALIADTPEAFADAVVQVYRDELLWARLVRNAALLVEERFSEAVVRGQLEMLITGSGPGEHRSDAAGGSTP